MRSVTRGAVNRAEWREAVRTGQVSERSHMLFDSQHWNQALRDKNATPAQLARTMEEAGVSPDAHLDSLT